MSKETRAHKLLSILDAALQKGYSINTCVDLINLHFEEIHSEAVQATIMANNKKVFTAPKFDKNQ